MQKHMLSKLIDHIYIIFTVHVYTKLSYCIIFLTAKYLYYNMYH